MTTGRSTPFPYGADSQEEADAIARAHVSGLRALRAPMWEEQRLIGGDICGREVVVTTATASGSGIWYERPADAVFLCLRPLPCDNPNHKPDRRTYSERQQMLADIDAADEDD